MAATSATTSASTFPESLPPRRELIRQLAPYARSSTAHGLLLFTLDVSLYAGGLLLVLFAPALGVKLAGSILAGLAQAKLMVLCHDAAHGTLVVGRRLNAWLGVVGLTLLHYNFKLWEYEHNGMHHSDTNGAHADVFTPLDLASFEALPRWRQWLERFYRSPNPLAFGAYFIFQRYWWTRIVPTSYLPSAPRRLAWRYFALVLAELMVLGAVLAAAPWYAVNLDSAVALSLGLLLPFVVFQCQNSLALYSQHTDPAVPWIAQGAGAQGARRTELLCVDVQTPRWMGWFYHDIFAHPVHHMMPRIPSYRVRAAQDHLNSLLRGAITVRHLGPRWLFETARRCKLYDWRQHRWLDFAGRPTTESLCDRVRAVFSERPGAEEARSITSASKEGEAHPAAP